MGSCRKNRLVCRMIISAYMYNYLGTYTSYHSPPLHELIPRRRYKNSFQQNEDYSRATTNTHRPSDQPTVYNTLADPGVATGARPPTGSNSFIFACVFTKKHPRRRLAPPPPPPQREILDPPLQ